MGKKLSLLLPLFQVGLGLLLELWGSSQAKVAHRGAVVYDYVSPPKFFLHLVNLPAALLTAAIFQKWTFKIGPENSWTIFVVYLFLIGTLWSWVGSELSRY